METSILNSTKQVLGLPVDYTVFDEDIVMHINTTFSTLTQLGVGPAAGFMIQGPDEDWEDFIQADIQLNSVKSYMFLKVKQLFDPPTTSFMISAMERQIQELEWRLNVYREETAWVDPNPPEEILYE
jgi:hypothetical protein